MEKVTIDQVILLSLVPLVAMIFWLFKRHTRGDASTFGATEYTISAVLAASSISATFTSWISIDIHELLALAVYVLAVMSPVVSWAGQYYLERLSAYFYPLALIPLFVTITIAPVSVLLDKDSISTETHITDVDIVEIERSISSINKIFSTVESKLRSESESIDELMSRVKVAIKENNEQLDQIRKEQIAVQEEADYYQALASLSKEQAEAVASSLNRGKYFEYLIGLIVGITSSVIASILIRVFRRDHFLEQSPNKQRKADA